MLPPLVQPHGSLSVRAYPIPITGFCAPVRKHHLLSGEGHGSLETIRPRRLRNLGGRETAWVDASSRGREINAPDTGERGVVKKRLRVSALTGKQPVWGAGIDFAPCDAAAGTSERRVLARLLSARAKYVANLGLHSRRMQIA